MPPILARLVIIATPVNRSAPPIFAQSVLFVQAEALHQLLVMPVTIVLIRVCQLTPLIIVRLVIIARLELRE